jgi:hypothetical protein
LEAVTELGPVDLENSPVLRETTFTDAETDSWGAEDMSKDAVDGFFVDPIEQRSKCLHRVLGLALQPLSTESQSASAFSASTDSVGALLPLHELYNLFPPGPALNRNAVSSDPEFDQIDEVCEGSLSASDVGLLKK